MALNIVPKSPYLKRLTCAYTGKPAEVRMVSVGSGDPLYFSAEAFDPGAFVPKSEDLFRMLSFRDGVEGAARGGRELFCPYTGEKMTVQHVPGLGFRAVGGFRPSVPQKDPFKFAADMMTRDGITPSDAPKPARVAAAKVEDTDEGPIEPIVSRDSAMEMAETIIKKSFTPKPGIVAPGGVPKKGKK